MNITSCFQYEDLNRKILSFIKGHDLVCQEFIKVFSTIQIFSSAIDHLESSCPDKTINDNLRNFFHKYSKIKTSNFKKRKNEGLKIISIKKDLEKKIFTFTSIIETDSLYFNNIYFSNLQRESRFNDSAIKTDSKKFGLIEKILVLDQNRAIFYCKQLIFLSNPFWVQNHPELKLDFFLCKVTDQYFFEEIEKITKVFFFQLDNYTTFVSTFKMNHLFN